VQPLSLKVGAEVMLRVNAGHRLVNGAVGKIVGFVPAKMDNLKGQLRKIEFVKAALDVYVNHQQFTHGVEEPLLPVVKFNGIEDEAVIPPWPFSVGGDALSQHYELTSVAIPLMPAYAFTIHKVQGLTLLGPVRLELQNLWQCKHAIYVAMSRVRSPQQLSVSDFREDLVTVDNGAVLFDRKVQPIGGLRVDERELPIALWQKPPPDVRASASANEAGFRGASSALPRGALNYARKKAKANKRKAKEAKQQVKMAGEGVTAATAHLMEALPLMHEDAAKPGWGDSDDPK